MKGGDRRMYKILLVSHGVIAKGFYDTMPMILGTQADVAYACLDETGSVEQFEKTVIHQLNEVWGQDEVLVLADMMNGTPSRVAAQLISQRSCKGLILCGMNLNVLLEAYMKRNEDLQIIAQGLLTSGKPSFMELYASTNEGNE